MGSPIVPSLALAAYLEPLLQGRRVIVFGSATSGIAGALIERGARLVQVFDPEVSRVAEAAALQREVTISYAPLSQAGPSVRDGAFDVGLVEDLSAFSDVPGLLKQLRRALAVRGVALIASPNRDVATRLLPGDTNASAALGYYELYDVVASEFEQVRMLGQAPFVGYTIVEFGLDREPEIAFDNGLLPTGSEEPEWFLALGARHQAEMEAFSIVQVPFTELGLGTPRLAREELTRALHQAEEARASASALHSELAALREAGARVPAQRNEERAELERELGRREAWIQQLEARAATADERADRLQSELESEREERDLFAIKVREEQEQAALEAQRQQEQLRAKAQQEQELLSAKLREQEQLAAKAREQHEARVRDLALQIETLEQRLAAREHAVEPNQSAQEEVEQLRVELHTLELQLLERAQRVRQLERELLHTERTGLQLTEELERVKAVASSRPGAPAGELTRLAKLEADLQAAHWSVAELEQRLSFQKVAGTAKEA